MALFKISKGTAANLVANRPYAAEGNAYFTTDDGKFYIDIAGDGSTTPAVVGTNRIPLNAAAADKLLRALTIQFNGGTTPGRDLFTFDGSVATSVNITPNAIGALPASGTATAADQWSVARDFIIADSDGHSGPATAVDGTANVTLTLPSTIQADIIGNASTADSLNNSLSIQFNSGTTVGTNLFTFNGSAPTSINITPAAISAVNKTGDTMSGDLILYAATGDTPSLIFQRGTDVDNLDDLRLYDSGGKLVVSHRSGSATWTDLFTFDISANVSTQHLLPSTDNALSLGASDHKWATVYATTFSGNATSADKVNNKLTIQLNSGTDAQHLYEYDGSSAKTVNITPALIGALATSDNAPTASTWATARDFYISDATGANTGAAVSVDGSTNVTLKLPSTIHATLDGKANEAGFVTNNLQIQFNGGTTENSNLFTYNGSVAKLVNLTPAAISALALAGGTMTGSIILPVRSSALNTDGSIMWNSGNTTMANIGVNTSGQMGIYASNQITLRPMRNDTTKGVEVTGTAMYPTANNGMTLGTTTNKWSTIYATSFNGLATEAAKVSNKLTVQLNSLTDNQHLFEYDGSAAVTMNITPALIGALGVNDNAVSASKWVTARKFYISDSTNAHTGVGVDVDGSGDVILKLPTVMAIGIAGNAETADKVNHKLNIQLNSLTDAQHLFEYDGSAAVTVNITPALIGAMPANGSSSSAATWTTARNFYISDADNSNTGAAVSVDGSANVTLKLPAIIKATLKGKADEATKVTNKLKIQLNSLTDNQHLFEYDGSAAQTVNITPALIGALASGDGAVSAAKWTTARDFKIASSDGSNIGAAVSVDGSGNVTLKLASTIKATLDGKATEAGKVTNALTIQLNSGTDAQHLFTYNGSTAPTINITPELIGAMPASGAATSAAKWTTARDFTISSSDGSNTGAAVSVDGSGNVNLKLASTIKASLDGNATSADKVNHYLQIQLNGGTTEGTNLFTYDGSAQKGVNITPAAIGALATNGTAVAANRLTSADTRNTARDPQNTPNGITANFKSNATAGLTDGGNYTAVLSWRSYPTTTATSTDFSGGKPIEIAYSENGNLWLRQATNATTWGSWKQLAFTSSDITGNAATATKVKEKLTIQFQSGTTEGTDLFTYDGSVAKSVQITPAKIGAVAKSGDTMTGFLTLHADPTNAMHAVTKQYADSLIAAADSMVYKGTLSGGASSPGTYTPAANAGWTYRVDTAGYINGEPVEIGDLIICNTDSTAAATSSNYTTIKQKWNIIQVNVDNALYYSTNALTADAVIIADNGTGKVKTAGTVGSNTCPIYLNGGKPTALSYTANRLYYSASTSSFEATGHYASSTKLAINSTSAPSGALHINGATTATDNITVTKTNAAQPEVSVSNGTHQVGIMVGSGGTNHGLYSHTATADWIIYRAGSGNTYIPNWKNIGNTDQPIYIDANGRPTVTQFALKATVNNGTATRIAYYSGANAISSGSITSDGGYLGAITYLSINNAHQTSYRLYVNGKSYFTEQVYLNFNNDVVKGTEGTGNLIIGPKSGEHIAIDGNEIMAKSNGTTAGTLYLNDEGGIIRIGADLTSKTHNTINLASDENRWKNIYSQVLHTTIQGGTNTNAGGDKGSSANPRYFPQIWTFNAGITPVTGDIVTIKTPAAGHDYGVFLSTNNGTNYYPITLSGSGRMTTHYPTGTFLTLMFDGTGSAASMFALAGQNNTTRVTVSGGTWRVINYYDSGNPGDWNLRQYNIKAAAAIRAVHIIGGTDSGYKEIDGGNAFDIRYAVLYAGSAIGSGSQGNNNFIHHYAINIRNSSDGTIGSLTQNKNIYIKGTISGTTFTPISGGNPYVQDITAADDGYVYYYIGRTYNASNALTFDATGRDIYIYKNGAVRKWSDYSPLVNSIGPTAIGSTTKGIYWDGSSFQETSFTNGATIDSGVAYRIAYYSSANKIEDASTHYISDTQIHIGATTAPETGYSLAVTSKARFNSGLEVFGHIAGDTGTTGHGLWSGGGYHNAYNNIILHGDASTGTSGIAFVSDKGTTTINQPSDRAFIQWHAHGVTTYTAENTAPTLATSGENNVLIIGVGNDAGDQVRLQTPGRTGLLHQVGNTGYVIPDTNNTSGDVGAVDQPVYVGGGIIKACTYYLKATVKAGTKGGVAYYDSNTSIAGIAAGTASTQALVSGGANAPTWVNISPSITYESANTNQPTVKITVLNQTSAKANLPLASASTSGIVTMTTQSFAGIKTFTDATESPNRTTGAVKISGGLGVNLTMSALKVRVGDKVRLQYNSTTLSLDFIFE